MNEEVIERSDNRYSHWQYRVYKNHLLELILNREDAGGALNVEVLKELNHIIGELKERSDLWCLVLSSRGKHFSVGMEVTEIERLIGEDEANFRRNLKASQEVLDGFEEWSIPKVALLKGYVIGGGMILAAICDFRIATTKSVFMLPEIKRGIGVLMGTNRITRLIGLGRTKEMILLGERLSATKAEEYGFLHRLVEPQDLEPAGRRLAAKILALPPLTVRAAKRMIDQGARLDSRQGQDIEIESQAEILHSADLGEAVGSFLEGRPPHYTGS